MIIKSVTYTFYDIDTEIIETVQFYESFIVVHINDDHKVFMEKAKPSMKNAKNYVLRLKQKIKNYEKV